MSFNEEFSKNGRFTKNYSLSKLPNSAIALKSFSAICKPLKHKKLTPSVNISLEQNDSSQGNLKSEGVAEIESWRRAITEDSQAIHHLQTQYGHDGNLLYQKRNIDELIEKSYFPIVQLDSEGKLISFTAYDIYPNIPSVPSFSWINWLNSIYRLKGACARNVFFVHYMIWQPQQEKLFLRLLLETSFTEFLHLEYIIIVRPPHVNVPKLYEEYFIPILPFGLEKLNFNSVQTLLVCLRTSVIHSLPIRTAFEEEIDYVVPFIESHLDSKSSNNYSHGLKFVNFSYKQEKKTLICEYDENIAGVMVLNLKIDLDYLNEGFDLGPFNGLRKRDLSENNEVDFDSYFITQNYANKIQDNARPLVSSELLFGQMNWQMSLTETKDMESSLPAFESSDSFSSNSTSSKFFSSDTSSLSDTNSTETNKSSELAFESKNDFYGKPVEVAIKVKSSSNALPIFHVPKYNGPSNAFVIDFFAIDTNKINEKLSCYDFLEAAFKIIPDREYCVLLIPTDFLPLPLLNLFVRVSPRIMSSFKQELYLCHKNSLVVTSMMVRRTKLEDLIYIGNYLSYASENNKIYQDLMKSVPKSKEFQSFVLAVGENIVGVSLIQNQDCDPFHLYFDISDYSSVKFYEYENQSVIKYIILSPIYYNHARFFIRDIMRLADISCLYYVYTEENKALPFMPSIIEELVPVKPKRKAGLDEYTSFQNSKNQDDTAPLFSLHLITAKLCSFTKLHVNIIIVVVGASRTAFSFFENLIFGSAYPFVIYNNLICVTPHEVNFNDEMKNRMFPIRDNFSQNYSAMISLETYVNFIYGIMTEINRSEKYIVVNNKSIVQYDYLILTCGSQYLTPVPKAKETPKRHCKKYHKSPLARYLFLPEKKKSITPKYPMNMFVINTSIDAKVAIHTIQQMMNKMKHGTDKKIIIYGHNLQVFLTINTLLKLGIPGEAIAFVEPFPNNARSVTIFNDCQVDQAVLDTLKKLDVSHYKEYFLYDWSFAQEDHIAAITFQSRRKQLIIPCLAFFPFAQKLVTDVTFNACTKAGLVYDGRLIINHNFKTNDDYIYGAGPFTKYSRRYFANEQQHQFYNSREVGRKLAEILKNKIDPTVENNYKEVLEMVPRMTEPLLIYCQLPGDIYYLTLRKPGKELDLETAYNFVDYGDVLTTGDCKMSNGQGYFRLHLNAEGFVESITCFTKDEINYVNMYSLYGLHERLLNNLLFRYDLGLIDNFYDYFRQSWAFALFHEKFNLLHEKNISALEMPLTEGRDTNLIHKIVKKLEQNKWRSLSGKMKESIENKYEKSKIEEEVKDNLIQFLEYYGSEMSMYAIPSVVNSLLFQERSPFS